MFFLWSLPVSCSSVPPVPSHPAGRGVPASCSSDPPWEPRRTHTGRKHKQGDWKGLISSLLRVQGVTNYFFTVTPSAVHKVQVASGQQSNLTLPRPGGWQTLDPVPQKGCEAQGLCPRNQPHVDWDCSPTSTDLKEMSSALHAVWQLHQHWFAQIIKAPQR